MLHSFYMITRRAQQWLLHRFAVLRGRADETVEDRNYRYLLINGAWFGLIDGGIFTYLPVFLARLGASASLIGLLTSGPSLIGILSYIPGGAYTERHRDLVRLTVRATWLSRLVYPIIAFLPFVLDRQAISIAVVILWSLASIPAAVHVPAWTAVMQKAVSARRRAQLNGTRWALLAVVSAAAIAGFGYLLDQTPFPAGYQIVFTISFLAAFFNLYFFGKVQVPPFAPEPLGQQAGRSWRARLREFLRPFAESRPFLRYMLASLPYRLALNLPVALYSIYWVDTLRASDTWIGLRGTAGYVALVVGYAFWGRVANRLGHRNLLLICCSSFGLYPVLTALAPSMEWLLPAAIVWGFTAGGLDIGLFDMLLAVCPDGRQPTFAAAAQMLVSVVAFVGPLIGAALADALTVRTALFLIGGLQIAAALLFFLLPRDDPAEG